MRGFKSTATPRTMNKSLIFYRETTVYAVPDLHYGIGLKAPPGQMRVLGENKCYICRRESGWRSDQTVMSLVMGLFLVSIGLSLDVLGNELLPVRRELISMRIIK
jgi:hypothetical protein